MTEERKRKLEQKYANLSSNSSTFSRTNSAFGGNRARGMAAQGKPKDAKATVRRLIWYLSREGTLIVVGMITLLLTTLGTLMPSTKTAPSFTS